MRIYHFVAEVTFNIIVIKIEKRISSIMGSATIITNNEIKAIIKVIKSLENRGILVKGTATKITSQEGRFLNFLRPLMKSVFRPLAKSVLIPFG